MKTPAKARTSAALVSQEDVDAALEGGAEITPVSVPSFYATSVRMAVEPHNVNLVFARMQPVDIRHGNTTTHAGHLAPAFMLDLSPQTAKDLLLLLQDGIAKREAEWGVIETEFSRKREERARAEESRVASKGTRKRASKAH